MGEPSAGISKLALAVGVLAAMAVGGAGFLIGRAATTAPSPPARATPEPAPVPPPTTVQALHRADLLALNAAAADALASGAPTPEAVRAAAGRRFTLYLPFGCDHRASGEGPTLVWRYDAGRRVLKLRVALVRWTAADWWPPASAPAGVDSVAGLWVARPWSSAQSCPPVVPSMAALTESNTAANLPEGNRAPAMAPEPAAPEPAAPEQTLAIAQLLPAGSPRSLLRDGRLLEADLRMPADFTMPAAGLRLRLAGRLDPQQAGGPIICIQPAGRQQRPLCLILATFEEAVIENPDTGARLISWPLSG